MSRKQIIIALDTAREKITIHGWRKRLALRAEDVMLQLVPFCAGFLCTDVDREGTMTGANLDWFRKLRGATQHPINRCRRHQDASRDRCAGRNRHGRRGRNGNVQNRLR